MQKPRIAIHDFQILRPQVELHQQEALEWLVAAHIRATEMAGEKNRESEIRNLFARYGHPLPNPIPDRFASSSVKSFDANCSHGERPQGFRLQVHKIFDCGIFRIRKKSVLKF